MKLIVANVCLEENVKTSTSYYTKLNTKQADTISTLRFCVDSSHDTKTNFLTIRNTFLESYYSRHEKRLRSASFLTKVLTH